MRYRAAEMFHVEKAVNGVTLEIEEDRMRHRRIIPFLRVMVGIHTVRLEGTARRVIAGPSGRDRPDVTLRAIDRDRHLLRAFVDPECLRTPSIEVSRRSLVQSRRL
jgi:hypothetical protein